MIMKCIVHNCKNTNKQGRGVHLEGWSEVWRERGVRVREWTWICMPCFDFITKGEGKNSSVVRNVEQILKELPNG